MNPRPFLFVLFALPVAAGPVVGQTPDPAAFVRELYVRYAAVEPTPQMIDFWVKEMRKGTEPNEVLANVLGSDQAFARSRRNNEVWVNALYTDLLGRPAEAGGVAHWLQRLRELRDDRVKLAREFVRSAGAEIAAGGIGGPGTPQDLPTQFVTTIQLMHQAAQTECPGRDGWMIREQAKAVATTTTTYSRVLQNPAVNPRQYAEAVTTLDAGLTQFRSALAQSRLPAQSTRLHAEQATQILAALAAGGNVPPPIGPPGLPGGLSRADARRLEPLANAMSRETAAANATFQAVLRADWNNRGLLRQVEAVSTEADSLRSDVRAGYPLRDLLARTQSLTAAAAQVSAVVAKGGVDPRLYQAWYKATADLNAFTAQVGTLGGGVIAPPIGGGVAVPREAFAAVDRAAAECDALIVAFSPYTFFNRPSARLTSDLQSMKNQYAALRREAAGVTTERELKQHLDGIATTLRSAANNWREANRDPRFRAPADLDDLTAADREVVRLISSAR